MNNTPDMRATDAQRSIIKRRRERLIAEVRQMQNDIDHWNRTHPDEEPIVIDFDFTKDIEAAKAAAKGE